MAIFRTKKAEETEDIRLPRHIAIILDVIVIPKKPRPSPRRACRGLRGMRRARRPSGA